jgi:Tol biopolymer transport system component
VTTRQLTHGTSLVERPRISPDGTQVLFSKGHEANANLYMMPLGGGEARAVTFFKSFNVGGAWSPDGRSIAFGSTEGGRPRVWVTEADGHNPRAVSSGDFSDSFDVQWSAAGDVLYQQSGNRNYYVLDVRTGRERPFMSDTSLGWVFSPIVSPDGTRIVFAWSRRSGYGLWVRDTRDASERLLYGASIPTPIGWSPDGRSIYAYEGERAASRGLPAPSGETSTRVKVVQVSETGRATILFTLPFDEVGGITITPDGRHLICTVYSSRSDVWMVEHFDGRSTSEAKDRWQARASR